MCISIDRYMPLERLGVSGQQGSPLEQSEATCKSESY